MPPRRELLMGIDVGTTNVRCALYDTDARLVALGLRSTAAAYASGGRLDADALWAVTLEACTDATAAAYHEGGRTVRGIAVSSIGCVPVWLDAADQPYAPDASDRARVEASLTIAASMPPTEVAAITGYPLDVLDAACFMAALPDADRVRARTILSVADWIAYRLTGRIVHEFSTALSYGVWDYRRGGWWTEYLARIGLDPAVFGTPIDSGRPIGGLTADAADALGLPRTTPVSTGGHDYLAAALAAGLRPGHEVLNVTGTIEIMASLCEGLDGRTGDGGVRSVKDHHVVAGQSSYMIEALGAGQVEWFRSAVLTRPGEDAPDLDPYFAALETLPPSYAMTRELFIPHLRGRLLPVSDMRATGGFLGIGILSGAASMFRAMIEGLCFQARQMLEEQRVVLGAGDLVLKSVGGGTRSAAWRQIKADILGTPIHVPRIREASALGAALLAGIGAGVYRGPDEASAVAAALGEEVIEPMPRQSERYQDVFHEVYLPAIADLAAGDARMAAVIDREEVTT